MSAILTTKPRPALSRRYPSIPSGLRICWVAIKGYFERRAAMARLGEFDECALRDIGITRSQIEAAVRGAVSPAAARGSRRGE